MMHGGHSPAPEARGADCCRHSGYYTGQGVYSRDSQSIRYVLVCDDCGEEIKEISTLEYVPSPVLATIT
jgi:hypothetical protein